MVSKIIGLLLFAASLLATSHYDTPTHIVLGLIGKPGKRRAQVFKHNNLITSAIVRADVSKKLLALTFSSFGVTEEISVYKFDIADISTEKKYSIFK